MSFSCLNNDRTVMLKWLRANFSKFHLQFINRKMLHNVLIQHKTTLSYNTVFFFSNHIELYKINGCHYKNNTRERRQTDTAHRSCEYINAARRNQ